MSLEFDEHAQFEKAARLARQVIQQVLDRKRPEAQLYNLNIPTAALNTSPEVKIVPMGVQRYGESRDQDCGRED